MSNHPQASNSHQPTPAASNNQAAPDELELAPKEEGLILAVSRVDPGDPVGNERRKQAALSRMLAEASRRHGEPAPSKESGKPSGSSGE